MHACFRICEPALANLIDTMVLCYCVVVYCQIPCERLCFFWSEQFPLLGYGRDREQERKVDADRARERPRDNHDRAREREREHKRRMGVPETRIAEDERHKAKQASLTSRHSFCIAM